MTEVQCSGGGPGGFHAMALGFPFVRYVWECQGSRMEVAAPTLLRRRFSHKSLWTKHQSCSLRRGRRKPRGNPARLRAVAALTLTWDESAHQEENGLIPRSRRGSLTNFEFASAICLSKRAVHPAIMKRHPEATRPNGAQKRHRWSGNSVWPLPTYAVQLHFLSLTCPRRFEKPVANRGQSNGTTCPQRDAAKVWSCQWKRQRQINIEHLGARKLRGCWLAWGTQRRRIWPIKDASQPTQA